MYGQPQAAWGALKVLGGGFNALISPGTTGLDLLGSSTHGRGAQPAPVDREVSNTLVTLASLATGEFGMVGKGGSLGRTGTLSRSAGEEGTVILYRVDDAAFAPRISADGTVPIVTSRSGGERALFVGFDQSRAVEFAQVNRKGNATITSVEVDASFLDRLRATSVYDKSPAAGLRPNAPLLVDINKGVDQFGLRTSQQIQMLRDAIQPATVRVIPAK